jgi:hypothetical protein
MMGRAAEMIRLLGCQQPVRPQAFLHSRLSGINAYSWPDLRYQKGKSRGRTYGSYLRGLGTQLPHIFLNNR